jgi:hypothetical protein
MMYNLNPSLRRGVTSLTNQAFYILKFREIKIFTGLNCRCPCVTSCGTEADTECALFTFCTAVTLTRSSSET